MTDEIDLLRQALQKHDQVSRLKRINEELYSHLTGSIYYLLKYAEKQDIQLPQKEALLGMVERADFIIDQFAKPSTESKHDKHYRQGNRTQKMVLY
jgi:DNA replication initiation complex subunit (GINS family)